MFWLNKRLGEWRRGAVLVTIAVLLWSICQWVFILGPSTVVRRFVQQVELNLYDSRVAALPRLKPDPRVVIVGMDDGTPVDLFNHGATDRPYYPLPRKCHAVLVDRLFAAGAKVIAFDVMFAHRIEDEDRPFAAALRHHGAVVAPMIPRTERVDGVEETHFEPPSNLLMQYLIPCSVVVPRPLRWIDPYQVDDGDPGLRIPHFGFTAAAAYFGEIAAPFRRQHDPPPSLRDSFRWGSKIDAPLSNGANVLIRYAGPAGTFKSSPDFADVYHGRFPAGYFRGKIVLVGRISDLGVEDMQETPLGIMPGVEAHANVVQMALTGRYLRQAPAETASQAGALLIALFIFALWRLSLAPAIGLAVAAGLIWALGITTYQLRANALWVDPVQPLIALTLAVGVCSLYEISRARGQFERFVPSWVAARALAGDAAGSLVPGGDAAERPVTVVFCDIRSFTTISERHPQQAVELLTRFYEAGDKIARRHGTELDKYVGDEIMLYFFDRGARRLGRATLPIEPHPIRAVRWAQDMLATARDIDATGLAGSTGFRIGIGIATGVAREGLIGVQGRVQNTVIGDVVNTASRLQDATKDLKRPVVMNEAAALAAEGTFTLEPLGEITVRGKLERQKVFTVRV